MNSIVYVGQDVIWWLTELRKCFEKESFGRYADVLIEVRNKGEKTDIQVYCDGIERD